MARVITFFSKRTLTGTNGAATDYYSDVFDVTDVERLMVQLQVHGSTASGNTVTGQIYETNDPSFNDLSWATIGNPLTLAGTGFATKVVLSGLSRFVRAKVSLLAGTTVTVSLDGVGRAGS